jgi:hypothetical protein
LILAELVEAGGLDEHAGVGAGHARDGEHTDDGSGHEDVGVGHRNGNLAQVSVLLAADEDDVEAPLGRSDLSCQEEPLPWFDPAR